MSKNGEADFAFSLADSYNGRNPDGTYADNQTEAFISINCLDYAADDDPATHAVRGGATARGGAGVRPADVLRRARMRCSGRSSRRASRTRSPRTARPTSSWSARPTTRPPRTCGRRAWPDELQHGHLITYDGEGHTAYNKSNACVNEAVDDFLVDGTVPDNDPMC